MFVNRSNAGAPAVLWLLAGLMVAVEGALAASDSGWIQEGLRGQVYTLFAFTNEDFRSAVAGSQIPERLYWSLMSHAFLHDGAMHLILNAVAFLAFGNLVCQALGTWRFMLYFAVTAASGAIALALITDVSVAMVGASGVVFGLLGTITAWESILRRRQGVTQGPIFARIGALIAINLLIVIYLETEGSGPKLAWEAHLGGFVAGWILALLMPPRALRQRSRVSAQG